MRNEKSKKNNLQKGITLIALIITIFVLLIITAIAISVLDTGIINKEKANEKQYAITQEKEKLQKEVLEWKLINVNGEPTLEKYLKGIYGEDKVTDVGAGWLEVEVPSKNKYRVTANGDITSIDATIDTNGITIVLTPPTIEGEIKNGKAIEKEITATLEGAEGILSWESSNPDVAEIVTSEGNTRTIKLKSAGSAIITVKYAEDETKKAECKVEVTGETAALTLSPNKLEEKIANGNAIEKEITATLKNATGNLNWESSNPDVAEIVTSKGNTRTIKLKKVGTATITVTYAEDKTIQATCEVTVGESTINFYVSSKTSENRNSHVSRGGVFKRLVGGETVTDTLVATLRVNGENYSGATYTWTIDDSTIAELSKKSTSGNVNTLTLKNAGSTTVHVTCKAGNVGEVKGSIDVYVIEEKLGAYVKYNVEYTDMYTDNNYTSENGWRYFGTDSSGNKLLISTGVPLKLTGNKDYDAWWDLTTNSNIMSVQFNYGLKNNFEKIPYSQQETDSSETRAATGKFEARKEEYNGNNEEYKGITYDAIGDYFESSEHKDEIVGVRTLMIEEYLYATRRKLWA